MKRAFVVREYLFTTLALTANEFSRSHVNFIHADAFSFRAYYSELVSCYHTIPLFIYFFDIYHTIPLASVYNCTKLCYWSFENRNFEDRNKILVL